MTGRVVRLLVLSGCVASTMAARRSNAAERGLTVAPRAAEGVQRGDVLYRRSHAVVVGIDRYDRLPALTGAVRDAERVGEELERRGFDVTTLVDQAATREALTTLLGDRLPQKVGKEDRVLVFYAGHGLSTGIGGEAMGYVMPVGADRDAPRGTGIAMSEMQRWFAGYESKHVMFVADACYSGLALSTRSIGLSRRTKDYLRMVTSRPVRLAFVAGAADQEAHEWRGQGVFTRYFLDAISGTADANGDGVVTSDEIAAFVKPGVADTVRAHFGADQHPQMGRRGGGEFVFLARGREALEQASSGDDARPPATAALEVSEPADRAPAMGDTGRPSRPSASTDPSAGSEESLPASSTPASRPWGAARIATWAAGIGGLAAIGGGVVFGMQALSAQDEANACAKNAQASGGDCPEAKYDEHVADSESSALLGDIAWASALALFSTWAVLWITADESEASGVRISPAVSPRATTLGATLRF